MPPTLSFLGAARTVTGSRYLLETSKARILVDSGLFQDRDKLRFNWGDYGLEPSEIDAVVLTHGHLDHSGWLPKLVKEGFAGKIHCTSATADLAPILLRDSARIQMEDVRTKAKRHAKEERKSPYPLVPLYDDKDAEKTVGRLAPVPGLGEPVEVAPGVVATWVENGHILGASWICVEADGVRIAFSGDIGRWDRPILNDPIPPSKADYLVIESTYGNRRHPTSDAETEMDEILRDTAARGGNLLIPSFSVERAQELLYTLSRLGEKGKLPFNAVYLDSPMAEKVTDLFRKHPEVCDEEMLALMKSGKSPFAFAQLHYLSSADDSKKLNEVKGGAIIIAGNGMCTGGRIKHHLAQNIGRPQATVLFAGFQAPNTLGREMVDGADEIRLFNKPFKVKARIRQLNGLSGHADEQGLLRWVSGFAAAPKEVFVTHGDEEATEAFAAKLRSEKGWKTSNPAMGDRVALT